MKGLIRKLKTLGKVALGKDILVKPSIDCDMQRFGTGYGGWDVAINQIDNHSIIYSFGVGEDASFDMALIDQFDLIINAFDPTPQSIKWVKKQCFSKKFIMHEYGIAAHDGNVFFNPPENSNHVSHTLLDRPETEAKAIQIPVKRLSTIMNELGHDHIDIVKMDIEGAEYDVIKDISRSNIRPQQILIEFHHRFAGVGISKTKRAIERLRSIGYHLFAISDRNEEYGFILGDHMDR